MRTRAARNLIAAIAPQWPGMALVAAGAAVVLLAAARKTRGRAPAGVR